MASSNLRTATDSEVYKEGGNFYRVHTDGTTSWLKNGEQVYTKSKEESGDDDDAKATAGGEGLESKEDLDHDAKIAAACPLVIDNGSTLMRAGFSGDDGPRACYPLKVVKIRAGTTRAEFRLEGEMQYSASHYGLKATTPTQNRIVTDWEMMEFVWHHTFYSELRVAPEEHPVLLTEPFNNPKSHREKIVTVMFEKFDVLALYLIFPAVLSLYASGSDTGVVLKSGYEMTRVVSIYAGYALPHTVLSSQIGGCALTNYMLQLLNDEGQIIAPLTSRDKEVAQYIKEEHCSVALHCPKGKKENLQLQQKNLYELPDGTSRYELPDGTTIDVGKARYLVPEVLFTPSLIGKMIEDVHPPTNICVALLSARHKRLGANSNLKTVPAFLLRHALSYLNNGYVRSTDASEVRIQHMVFNSIQLCDVDIQREMYSNVVLSGGSTMFEGLDKRLMKELTALAPSTTTIQIVAPSYRNYSSWIGGSILASLSTFQQMWISKSEYREQGPSVVHKK